MNKKENKNVGSSNSSNGGRGKKYLKFVDKYEDPNGIMWYGTKRLFQNHPTYSSLKTGRVNHIFFWVLYI